MAGHDPNHDRWLGRVLEDRYEIVRPLGTGGGGSVYVARHLRLGAEVAIKIVDIEDRQQTLVKRLEREARAVALIGHENIVSVLDFGYTTDGSAFLVMQLLQGETVEQRLDRTTTLPLPATCAILTQVAYALEAAHDCGVIHRDIKPGNVFLSRERGRNDHVKVLDFGIAALQAGTPGVLPTNLSGALVVGTPSYIAPERLRQGTTVDHRADVYSVGAMMYEMLSGKPPFLEATAVSTMIRILQDEPEPVSRRVKELPLADAVDDLLARMLAKSPDERLPNMRAVRMRLVQLRQALSEPTRRTAEVFDEAPSRLRRPLTGWVTTHADTTTVELNGVLDERTNLTAVEERIVGPLIEIRLGRVTRINSQGAHRWTQWLRGLLGRGFVPSLHDASVAMIRQANLMPDFFEDVPVVSFQAPYYCGACGLERVFLFELEDVRSQQLPGQVCEACGGTMSLDDVEETYLLFARRRSLPPDAPV